MTERDAFSTQQAAALCGVDRRSMLRWVKAGVLPSYQTGGGRWRIQRADLLAFMAGRGMPIPSGLGPTNPVVAIVDDDDSFVAALRRAVLAARPDVEVVTASDGFSGGMLVAEERPDLLLLDVQMGGLDGVEVCRRIRANAALAAVKIVVVSGFLDEAYEAALRGLGVQACHRKPLAPSVVREVLDAHLPAAVRPAAR